MNVTEEVLEIIIGIALVILGVIYISSPQRFCRGWPAKQQARLWKLTRSFIGPALTLCGLAWLVIHFMG